MIADVSLVQSEVEDPDVDWLSGPEWIYLEREWAQDDLISFIKLYNPNYKPAWFHFLIAEKLKQVSDGEIDRLMIVMPPRHGKSTLISRFFPAWHLGRHPDDHIMATSYSGRLAHRFGRFTRNLIADDRYPFPGVHLAQDSRSADLYDIEGREGGYLAAGLDGTLTGEGADILLIDDPTKSAKEADSETMREGAIEWYTETAYPRLQARGRIVVVGTRWRDDDLLGYIMNHEENDSDEFEVVKFPAIDEDGKALWAEMYPIEELAKRRKNMTRRMWAAQYQADPTPDEGSIVKRWWWKYWHHPGQPLPPVKVKGPGGTPIYVYPEPLPTFFDRSLQSWDMNFQETTDGSFVCGQVWHSRGSRRYLMPDQYHMRVEFTDAVLAVKVMTARNPKVIRKLIERKANGPAVISQLRGKIGGIVAVEPEGSKESRVYAVSDLVEGGDVYLPHPSLASWVDAKDGFLDEWAQFPNAKNDDQVDAGTQALLDFEQKGHTATRATSYAGASTNGHSNGHTNGRDPRFGDDDD